MNEKAKLLSKLIYSVEYSELTNEGRLIRDTLNLINGSEADDATLLPYLLEISFPMLRKETVK